MILNLNLAECLHLMVVQRRKQNYMIRHERQEKRYNNK